MQKTFPAADLASCQAFLAAKLGNDSANRSVLECILTRKEDGHEDRHVVQVNVEAWNKGPKVGGTANIFMYERTENDPKWDCYGSAEHDLGVFHPENHGEKMPTGYDNDEEVLYLDQFFAAWLPATFPDLELTEAQVLS